MEKFSSSDLVSKVASLARVPQHGIVAFGEGLRNIFGLALYYHDWDVRSADARKVINAQLGKVGAAAVALKQCLVQLDSPSRRHLGLYALRQQRFGIAASDIELRLQLADLTDAGGMDEGELLVTLHIKAVDEIHMAASTRPWPSNPGAPSKWFDQPGNPNVKAFDLFVIELVRLIKHHGGRTTLDKNAGTGTLIEVLRAVAPYLPAGLMPASLFAADENGKLKGMSRLQRLRAIAWCTGQKPRPK